MSAGFFGALDQSDQASLLQLATRANVRAGGVLVAQGDPGDDVFFILSGEATAMQVSDDGRIVSYRDLGPGDLVGEIAALDGGPRSADVVAKTRLVVARLSRDAFRAALAKSPTLSFALLRRLAEQTRGLTARVYEKTVLTTRQRLIQELLRRARPGEGGGAIVQPRPTHAELAARIGAHREGVTKELSALADRGLILRVGRGLTIPSAERLAAALSDRA